MIGVTNNSVQQINAALIAMKNEVKNEVVQQIVEQYITQEVQADLIDDNIISQDKAWSSSKIADSENRIAQCTTAAGTAAKTASLEGFQLVKGAHIIVNVQNTNTVASALTLNVNNTGAKTIYINNAITSSSTYNLTPGYWVADYDGTYWRMDNACSIFQSRWSVGSSQTDFSRSTAYCNTAAGLKRKDASCRGFVLASGETFLLFVNNANSYNGGPDADSQSGWPMQLNVNSTGYKNLYINGAPSSSSNRTLPKGTWLVTYNGTYFDIQTRGCQTYPKGYVYIQLNGKKSPANMGMLPEAGCSWVDISSSYASYPYIKIGSGTTQSGRVMNHSHSYGGGMWNASGGNAAVQTLFNPGGSYGIGVTYTDRFATAGNNSANTTNEVNATYAIAWEVQ